jgi:hypothetical protein
MSKNLTRFDVSPELAYMPHTLPALAILLPVPIKLPPFPVLLSLYGINGPKPSPVKSSKPLPPAL